MKQTTLPYLEFQERPGKTYIYFRKGKIRHRLPDNPDTEEFTREYWAVRSGKRATPAKTNWNALIVSYYKSPGFRTKAAGTRANYRRHCEAIREKNGDKDVRRFRRKDALAVRDALQDNWSKANERLAVLSILCRHAVDLEWIDKNPVTDIPKLKGGEYEAWPETKLQAFERCCDSLDVDVARTAYELAIGTGQRLGDCVAMRWDAFDGEFMQVVQEKTDEPLSVFCPARLRRYLAALPRRGTHILAKNLTQPLGIRQVQKAIEDVRDKIGVKAGDDRLVPHGWRYNAAMELADAGCSDSDIQAVTGHRTAAMVQKYRAKANQKAASRRAQQARERNTDRT